MKTIFNIRNLLISLVAVASLPESVPAQGTCPTTSADVSYTNSALDAAASTRTGVVFRDNMGVGELQLERQSGYFNDIVPGFTETSKSVAAGDFDGDGWDDIVITRRTGRSYLYLNGHGTTPSPYFIKNKRFDELPISDIDVSIVTAADFNGDGILDLFRAASLEVTGEVVEAKLWLGTQTFDGDDDLVFDGPYDALAPGTTLADMGAGLWSGNDVLPLDYNNDRKMDFLVASTDNSGTIRIFLNTCNLMDPPQSASPTAPLRCADTPGFHYAGNLVTNMGLGPVGDAGTTPAFAYRDFDGDGLKDIIAAAPECCDDPQQRLRMWRGIPDGGVEANASHWFPATGAIMAVVPIDVSGDNLLDIVVGTDRYHYGPSEIGGQTMIYINNGTESPFSDGYIQVTTNLNPLDDLDAIAILDYDHDSLLDILIADRAETNGHVFLPNAYVSPINDGVTWSYVKCGDVYSEPVDLGLLADTEMSIISARITPTQTLNGGSISWLAANDNSRTWIRAQDCADDPNDKCVAFPHTAGRELRWRAVMCSSPDQLQTPAISGVSIKFDYIEAAEHIRSGVVIYDGVAYSGSFTQPGDRGHFYAINTGFSQTYWDFASKLDAMLDSDRRIYTASATGSSRLDFSWGNGTGADEALQATLLASDAEQAQDVINWVRSARFGAGLTGVTPSRLGTILTSTPAMMGKPSLPLWYTMATTDERTQVNSFIAQNSDRVPLVLIGSKSGMVHAIPNDATNISDPRNGTEAWAFIPPKLAGRMVEDYTSSLTSGLTINAFPDGSPTVADVEIGGQLRTIAVLSGGTGGSSIATLDVTETVSPSDYSIIGPTPLWHLTPGDADAGMGFSKPAIARVLIGGVERFIIIAGTGRYYEDNTAPDDRGRVLAAYDVADGTMLWRFATACPLSSQIAVFETDDAGEYNSPTIDGYMDRAAFADDCGNVYKVDPARDLAGGWNDNVNLGSIASSVEDGVQLYALFSTTNPGALGVGGERPITGNLGVRADASGRVVLYFGTGGREDYDPTKVNEFYAVYADDGSLRTKITGTCDATTNLCEKFYGGVVVTSEQIILTRSTDRRIGTGTCDYGNASIQAFSNSPTGDFVLEFSQTVASAAVGMMYGDAGAIYIGTYAGELVRVGTPRATTAGEDSATGNVGGGGTTATVPLTLMGWRQIF